jgi:hypothetical protein
MTTGAGADAPPLLVARGRPAADERRVATSGSPLCLMSGGGGGSSALAFAGTVALGRNKTPRPPKFKSALIKRPVYRPAAGVFISIAASLAPVRQPAGQASALSSARRRQQNLKRR